MTKKVIILPGPPSPGLCPCHSEPKAGNLIVDKDAPGVAIVTGTTRLLHLDKPGAAVRLDKTLRYDTVKAKAIAFFGF